MSPSPTSRDVAEAAGVSQSTVSRALAGGGRVAPATRSLVLEAAARLGYRPNAAARSLVTRRTHTIGVVAEDLRNPFFPELVDDLHSELAQAGYSTVLVADREARGVPVRDGRETWTGLDGLAFISTRTWSRGPAAAAAAGIPAVLLNREVDADDVDCVVSDNETGGALAGHHLLALGHRRIALISGPADTSTARGREVGFRRALAEGGAPLDEALRREGRYSYEAGRQWCAELLGSEAPPTAIFCGNDVIAFGALDVARRVGAAVPGDVSLIGYDDVDMSGWAAMALTTVRQPLASMARMAARLLVHRVNAGQPVPPRRHVFPPHLVGRATTAPPRDRVS